MSEEQEPERHKVETKPIDLDDLFSGDTRVSLSVKGRTVRFTLREKDSLTDLEYQRRLARYRDGDKSESSLAADVWLFDRLCTAIEVLDGEAWQMVEKKHSPSPDMKRTALFHYMRRIETAESTEGN